MLEHRPPNEVQPIKRINKRLARRRVALERPDVQLRARDRQVERRALLAREREVDFRGQAADLAAGKAVRARLIVEGLDVGRDERVHRLGDVGVEEDVGRARVEDDAAALLEERGRLAVHGDLRRRRLPVARAGLRGVDDVACGGCVALRDARRG